MLFYVAAFFAVLLLELFLLSTVILWHHALGWILLSALVLKFSKNERLKIVTIFSQNALSKAGVFNSNGGFVVIED